MNYEEFYNKVAELVKQAEQMHGEEKAEVSGDAPRCILHTYQDEPIVMKERTAKDGHTYFDHRTQVEGVWKKCKGQGYF